MACRIDRSRSWAVRCVHESQSHEENSFLTLTYDPQNLPAGGTLVKKHFQDFLKRLRKSIAPKKISFFHCGEYGELLARPHYHALIFGHDFADKRAWRKSPDGSQLYTSKILEGLWTHGFCTLGAVSFKTAAYCSAYILKKITGDLAEAHYNGKLPEYITMSTRPAIGRTWLGKYSGETWRDDTVVMNGREMKPPPYYDKLLKRKSADKFDKMKLDRKAKFREGPWWQNLGTKRQKVCAEVLFAKINLYKRNLS